MTFDKVSVLERENADLREWIAYLESCLLGSEISYAVIGLTGQEERVFAALMTRESLSKDQLLTLAYADKIDADPPQIKIIDVFICKIRKKLKPFGFQITTMWGRGYAIDAATKQQVRRLIESVAGRRTEAAE